MNPASDYGTKVQLILYLLYKYNGSSEGFRNLDIVGMIKQCLLKVGDCVF